MRYIIDRFEGSTVLCEDENKEIHAIPRAAFPEDAREGDVFQEKQGLFTPDFAEQEKRRLRIRRKMQDLFE